MLNELLDAQLYLADDIVGRGAVAVHSSMDSCSSALITSAVTSKAAVSEKMGFKSS